MVIEAPTLKHVIAKNFAEKLQIGEEIIFENLLEVINEEKRKKTEKYFVIEQATRQVYVFEVEDISYINNVEENQISFLQLASHFNTESSSMNTVLEDLVTQKAVEPKVLEYLQSVKNKPDIKGYFEHKEVDVEEEILLVIEINTQVEIRDPELNLETPNVIDVLHTPRVPERYNPGQHISRYQLKSIRHGKFNLDITFKGLIEGNLYNEKIPVQELRVKSLPPELHAQKVPRTKKLSGYYAQNTEIVLRITNNGIGEAVNVTFDGMNEDVRIISGETIGRIGVKARTDHPIVIRPNRSGELVLDQLVLNYEDGDGKVYKFDLPEIIYNVTTPQPELKIDVDSRRTVNPNEVFPVNIRLANIGRGVANQINVRAQIEPASSVFSGSMNNHYYQMNSGESVQISFELRAPESGNLKVAFNEIEFTDQEGKKLSEKVPSFEIKTTTSTRKKEVQVDWPFDIGARIDKYEILEKLGEGGFSHVYLARDTLMRTNRALKALKAEFIHDEVVVENFINETRNAQNLRDSLNIIQVFDVDTYLFKNKNYPYIVMEAILGGTLKEKIIPGKPLPTREACFVGLDICDALIVAHQRGMIHQDIKPSNIFYDEPLRWKLGDFGLARLTKGSDIISDDGTISYMAPEPNKSYKSDIYSLGLVLRQMLTGTRMGNIQEIRESSELSSDRTEKLINIIERMTHSNPNERPELNEIIEVLELSTIQRPKKGR